MSQPADQPDQSPPIEATPVQDADAREASRELSRRSGRVPSTVAGYDILRCLGEGSFGIVWLAREKKTGRQVAIKFFTNRRGLDWTLLTREVEKLAVLDASRDVVRLLDVGWDHDPPYFVMEYLPHESVANLLEEGPLSIKQSVEITEAVARALVHSHGAGILHCDIKPANILLDHGDEARLSDFGQSRLSSDQSPALGTFYYMAPEQASLDAVPDVRWDVYALGAVLYHMVTGSPPYHSESAQHRISNATVLSDRLNEYRKTIERSSFPSDHRSVPGVDSELAKLIDDCLNPIAALRIPNAQVILDRIAKRSVNRSRRPLMWLGLLGPVIFLLMTLWIAGTAVPLAVEQAEENLFEQSLESDAATVRLLAASIDQEIDERMDELKELAKEIPEFNNDLSDNESDRSSLEEHLNQWKRITDDRFSRQRRTLDISLFVTDRDGEQIFRNPWDDSVGTNYSWRDYFHGLGRKVERANEKKITDFPPRTEEGVSSAFRSTVTKKYMVAIAVPIWNQERTEVIGVLARTLHITDLLSQWEQRIRSEISQDSESPNRFLSLVDTRKGAKPYLLDHYWMSKENLEQYDEDRDLDAIIELSNNEQDILKDALADSQTIADYEDPLKEMNPELFSGKWLAAVARLNSADWIAIVQERRSEVVAPMQALRKIFVRYGQLMVVVFIAMLIGLGWLIRRLSRV